jgi:hypothetical protein
MKEVQICRIPPESGKKTPESLDKAPMRVYTHGQLNKAR